MPVLDNPRRGDTLADLIDRVLDKGLVINADITISVAGVELLGIKIRAALASFETAARYGLEFPSGTNLDSRGWKEEAGKREPCPQCGRKEPRMELLSTGCPWCGWEPPKRRAGGAERSRAYGTEVDTWLSKLTQTT
ncbi:gas vesicle protein [Carboxydochorda subterranea]|uniref:Gas vesicle protein n=1 Tax=Carboxydichorda subterranea TaxID=3109565 RepID=A0ABZ1BX85_9FIRM|nr:gas vesicle protein [Limnochorda sp. L945t]WRP17419.1 gas vesicle protein [Limnochorda sp. L945t]